ncbi:hypothetical protein [Endozoicomonas sp. 8E]|uniref:hypothetical protein n=1 Tax=Endozoicomonas sp. 8E TaxID=3035692 RepID=UPI0029391210|nr:hypothetical protein [Endozoicomonas sp. 8E]WOG29572.1 hypothetical protein P6910_07950 [Endozoicomonas sp. 8E]
MTNARPSALSLAVAIVISSSIIATQTLADRKLRTKSINILVNGHMEFTHSEAMVRPTLDPDQQPIPKSCTTTYTALAADKENQVLPDVSFTQVLSFVDGVMSIVDLFATDENDVAQKYTKVLKVGDEGVFRFTHNLEEKELVIEVRAGMTDQDSIEAVRAGFPWPLYGAQSLEPLTKIANPFRLNDLLNTVYDRTGNLGTSDHYVALATIEVEKVAVNGRTFMRHIASKDQPPELQRLGQSLFVNDDVLLAAATSAYIQVHVLGEELQQQALNKLLAHSKPVGYVVQVADDRQIHPVPAGYPKLEVAEVPGKMIVFHGQKLNPREIVFVENLYKLWQEVEGHTHAAALVTQVKKYKAKSYRYTIRSMQMAILEEFVARHGAEVHEDLPTMLTNEEKLAMHALVYYEYLQQALASATPDHTIFATEFEFTLEHIRVASSVITPLWVHTQLVKHFGFKPVLRNLLINPNFARNIQNFVPVINDINQVQTDSRGNDKKFAAKVIRDMTRQLLEKLEELQAEEEELVQLHNNLRRTTERANVSQKGKLRAQRRYREVEEELARVHIELEDLENQELKILQQVQRIPELEKQVRNIRAEATKALNTQMAAELGIDNWDDAQPPEEQNRLIRKKIYEIKQWLAAGRSGMETLTAKLAVIEGQFGIIPVDENDVDARYQTIQQHMQQMPDPSDGATCLKLASIESQLNLAPDNEADLVARRQAILDRLQRHFLATSAEAAIKSQYKTFAVHLNIEDFDFDADIDFQQKRLLQRIKIMHVQEQFLIQKLKTMDSHEDVMNQKLESLAERTQKLSNQQYLENSYTRDRKDALAAVLGKELSPDDRPESRDLLESTVNAKLFELVELKKELDDIKTPAPPKAMPEVLGKLRAVESVLKMDLFSVEDDAYLRRQAISDVMQTHIKEARQRSQEEALKILEALEELFNIKINEGDDKTARLDQVRIKLAGDQISEYMLDQMDKVLWEDGSKASEKMVARVRLDSIRERLTFKVEESDKRAEVKQAFYLMAIEEELKIDPYKSFTAMEKGMALTAKLANDLGVEFEKDLSLFQRRRDLCIKTFVLMDKVNENYEDESVKRLRNNELAHQLNIEDFKVHVSVEEQNSLITEKLIQLNEAAFKGGWPDVNERISFIENELDRQIARLGPKPRYALDRELAIAKRVLEEAEHKLTVREQAPLEDDIRTRESDIEKMKEVLINAGKAVENNPGPFQFTPKQAEVRDAIQTFAQQHAVNKQALEAAFALAESAVKSGNTIPCLTAFDFDNEFAAIRMQALVGDELTFAQASRLVELFKRLKTSSLTALEEVQILVHRARNEIKTGAQEYDDEIYGMGKTALHFVEHEPKDLKGFSEYFAARSASGNRIIALLREGLISRVELENYMKAVRGVDGYQTVDEFEHFLDYKHGIRVSEFRKVVQMLSDKGAEEFIQSVLTPVTLTANGPAGLKESVAGMKEYAVAVIANYVLDDIAFDNGRRTAAFLANAQDTLTPYANAVGISESELIKAIHDTLMQAHAAAVEQQLKDYWVKPSAFLVQAVTWYYSSYKPLLVDRSAWQAAGLSLSNMSFLYLLDLTNRGDYLHRMLTPFQHWLERYSADLDRTGQYAYHSRIEHISEVGGLAMPLGKAASAVILLKTGSMLFARQHNANPQMYRSIFRLVPEIVKSMGSRQGIQVPLLHRVTPHTVKTLASAAAGLVLGPVATTGTYVHSLLSGFTYTQTFAFALASSLTFDFFMNDNRMLTQWLGGPLGRSLDKINRWIGMGETDDEYGKRTAVASPQRFTETDEDYANRVKASNSTHGWTRQENYLQFRERRDRTMKLFENSWEKYFRENVPEWSFSHAESIPYSYTLGAFYKWRQGYDQIAPVQDNRGTSQPGFLTTASGSQSETEQK